MNQSSPASRAGRSGGPRPVPGRSALPAPALRKNHRGPRPCVAAAGGDRPRSESDRFMVLMHAKKRKGPTHKPERRTAVRHGAASLACADLEIGALSPRFMVPMHAKDERGDIHEPAVDRE